MNLKTIDAIYLIVEFMIPLGGYWLSELENNIIVKQFIKEGGASLDEEYEDKYLINDTGKEMLHPYIEKISRELIHYMLEKGASCSEKDGANWMMSKYGIDDFEIAEELMKYIAINLGNYGYQCIDGYQREKNGNFEWIKVYSITKIG